MAPTRHRTESRTSPRRLKAVERQRQALELRSAGRSWDEIAQALDYSDHTGAIRAVESALKRTLTPPAETYRALTTERLTAIIRTFWPIMVAPTNAEDARVRTYTLDEKAKAAHQVLRAIEQMRGLLNLDVPAPPQVGTDEDPLVLELRTVQDYDFSNFSDEQIKEILGHARIVEERLALPPGGGSGQEAPGG